MLKVKLTENYAGFTIYGDYDDLDFLYDSINYLIHVDAENIGEYVMQNHIYGFLYDVRHAYQGQRSVSLIDNSLNDNTRNLFNLKKKDITDKNIYFSFNYLLPDLLLDMILIKHFIYKIDKKENDIYNPYLNMVNYFYSIVLQALKEILTNIRFNKVKKALLESVICDSLYIPQWFEIISSDYANMNKEKRVKEFMHIADAIYNYGDYEDYFELKEAVEKTCKEKNCTLDCLHCYDYPDEIDW